MKVQELNGVSQRTPTRDLTKLVSIGIFEQIGITGRGTFYIIRSQKEDKRLIKDSNKRGMNVK